jgi:hypothetical protein
LRTSTLLRLHLPDRPNLPGLSRQRLLVQSPLLLAAIALPTLAMRVLLLQPLAACPLVQTIRQEAEISCSLGATVLLLLLLAVLAVAIGAVIPVAMTFTTRTGLRVVWISVALTNSGPQPAAQAVLAA